MSVSIVDNEAMHLVGKLDLEYLRTHKISLWEFLGCEDVIWLTRLYIQPC
jgi:hypothetical protein